MKSTLRVIGLLAALVALAACGSSSTHAALPAAKHTKKATTSPTATPSASQAAASKTLIKTEKTSIGTVLATSKGLTIYWFGPDTAKKSDCNGACASYWPPVKGPAAAAPGTHLTGKFGTITRADGTIQATYDGHPLYTYLADSAVGQVKGNGVDASGGLWYAMTPTAVKVGIAPATPAAAPTTSQAPAPPPTSAPAPMPSSSSGGGGYGY
jgi:predicted lipoprotein with Yx(FWY)xxD motif